MKALRYIIFIPIIFIIIATVYFLIPLSLLGLFNLNKIQLIIFLIFFGGITVGIFQFLPGAITWLSAKISPSKTFAFYTILIISVLLAIDRIYVWWTTPGIFEYGLDIFTGIIFTCITIGFATSFSVGAGIKMLEEKSTGLNSFLLIGAAIFYLGIFLVFCLLSTKICDINPDKTYKWYSGILHGIFVIPNWVVSLFSNDIYCKAPNSTTAYSIWWWISFIFIGLGMLSGGNRRREY